MESRGLSGASEEGEDRENSEENDEKFGQWQDQRGDISAETGAEKRRSSGLVEKVVGFKEDNQ